MVAGLSVTSLPAINVEAADSWSEVTSVISNSDFESDLSSGWSCDIDWNNVGDTWTKSSGMANNTSMVFHYYATSDTSISLYQTISLGAGTYKFSIDAEGYADTIDLYLGDEHSSNNQNTAWDTWNTIYSNELTIDEDTDVKLELLLSLSAEQWGDIDDIKLYKKDEASVFTEIESMPPNVYA